MARKPAIMLYKGDWKRDPQLSMCSPATRGIWIDLICDMDDLEKATITGTAAMIARMCRASSSEVVSALNELRTSGAADITEDKGTYTVHSRRIEKDLHVSKVRSSAVQNRYKTSTKDDSKPNTKSLENTEDENEELLKEELEDPGVAGKVLGEKVGNTNFRFQEQISRQITAKAKETSRTLRQTVDWMVGQWERYNDSRPLLNYPKQSAQSFFESGTWHDSKLWPWKEGSMPSAPAKTRYINDEVPAA